MTRKDYVVLAQVIQDVTDNPVTRGNHIATAVVKMLARRMSAACAGDNDNYEEGRFFRTRRS